MYCKQIAVSCPHEGTHEAAGHGLDKKSSTLVLFQSVLSSAHTDTETQATFWCGSTFHLCEFRHALQSHSRVPVLPQAAVTAWARSCAVHCDPETTGRFLCFPPVLA